MKISEDILNKQIEQAERAEDWALICLLLELKQHRAEVRYERMIYELSTAFTR